MTYTSLLQDLRSYLERGFTEASDKLVFDQLPRLVTLAERRIARDLKILGFIRTVQTPLVAGMAVYQKPDRWRDTVSMRINGVPIQARSYEYLRSYWPVENERGTPEFYADHGYAHWLLAPTPIAVVPLEVSYYEQPAFLGDSSQTNWITEYAPDVMLYASLLEATPFLKNDVRIAVWQGLYDKGAAGLLNENQQRVVDRAAVRTEA